MDSLPGFRDFYPEPLPQPDAWSADARQFIFNRWRATARTYGFREYDGPPLELLELYTTKSGEEIVAQLYNFLDKGDRAVALRPEMTPTLARMVAAAERNYKKPIKWFAVPQLFRYERQAKGRLREHFQFNADIIGETDPAADAEIVALLIDSLRAFALTSQDFVVRLSSRQAWQEFFSARGADSTKAYEFYQLIDKLDREEEAVSRAKLLALGFTLEEVRDFIQASRPTVELQAMLDNLTARGLGDFVRVDYGIIRGLAYYTGVVFEAFDRKGHPRAIAGGGRYDNLIKQMSGGKVDMPALGFGMGDVVLLQVLRDRGLIPAFNAVVDVFCLVEDESLRAETLGLIGRLREAGCAVDFSLTPAKPDKQFKRALELGASATVKLQRAASGRCQVRLKILRTRAETVLEMADAVHAIRVEVRPELKPGREVSS